MKTNDVEIERLTAYQIRISWKEGKREHAAVLEVKRWDKP